jgi:hypothetical protein
MSRKEVGNIVCLICLFIGTGAFGQQEDKAHVYVKYEPHTWVDSLWSRQVLVYSPEFVFHGVFNSREAIPLSPGRYVFSFSAGPWSYSLGLDTLVEVVSGDQWITPHLEGKAKENEHGRSLIGSMVDGDTLYIYYREHYCCGGSCCEYKDRMWLVKAEGSFWAFYYSSIKDQNCLGPEEEGELKQVNVSERSLKALKRLDVKGRSHSPARYMHRCSMELKGIIQQCDGYFYQNFKEEFLKGLE